MSLSKPLLNVDILFEGTLTIFNLNYLLYRTQWMFTPWLEIHSDRFHKAEIFGEVLIVKEIEFSVLVKHHSSTFFYIFFEILSQMSS